MAEYQASNCGSHTHSRRPKFVAMPRLLLLGVALVHITAAAAATGTSETSDPVNGVSGSGDDETPTLVPFAQPTIVPSTASPTPGPTAAPALLLTQAGPCMEYGL